MDVSAYVIIDRNFFFRTNAMTDSHGIVKLYLSPDSSYKINGNWLGTPVDFAYWPEVANLAGFQEDTFVLRIGFINHFGSLWYRKQLVYFATNSDTLIDFYKDAMNEMINRYIQILSHHPTYIVHVTGHSDNKGSEDYNIQISQRRANSVKAYLISKGIDKAKIITKAVGAYEPIVSNQKDGADDPEDRAQNRRVEFRISAPPKKDDLPVEDELK
jgi:outer membrane protein OmpA-like peptidoglycan-associated protein